MTDLTRELRWTVRRLRSQPVYAVAIAGTVAIAIAVSAIAFSFIDVAVLRPLPFGHPDRTVFVYAVDTERGFNRGRLSPAEFERVAAHPALAGAAAYTEGMLTATGFDEPLRVAAAHVTPNLLRTWELPMTSGVAFPATSTEDEGAPPVLLSHRFWVTRYGSDPDVRGRALLLNERPYVIAGVVGPSIEVGDFARADVWVPLSLDVADRRRSLLVTASLAPGTNVAAAQSGIQTMADALRREDPAERQHWSLAVLPMREAMTGGGTNVVLVLLLLVVVMIFGVACANVTNMMTADAVARRGDTAMRLALGAALGTLLRQRAIEVALLVIIAGAAGLAAAAAGLTVLRASSSDAFFRLLDLNPRVLAMTTAWALAFMLVASVMPTLYTWRTGGIEHLRDASPRAAKGRVRAGLVAVQLAFSFTLLVVSGLSAKTASNLAAVPSGIDAAGVSMVQLALDGPRYTSQAAIAGTMARSIARLRRIPGVAEAAACAPAPLVEGEPVARLEITPQGAREPLANAWAYQASVSAGYFSALHVPIVRGRPFTDGPEPASLIVNREMARRYWDGRDPVGQQVRVRRADGRHEVRTVIGIAGDVRSHDARVPVSPRLYLPIQDDPPAFLTYVVRSVNGAPVDPQALRQALWDIDRAVAVPAPRTYADLIARLSAGDRTIARMFLIFAVIALVLSAAGLYGLTSYGVRQQRASIAIRMALGATKARVVRELASQHLRVCVIEALLGLAGAMGAARLMRGFVYGVAPFDAAIFAAVAAILFATALLAMYLPMRHVARIEPASVLRAGG